MADQRLAAPVLGDVGEEAMLDLVPFAGAGRKVATVTASPVSLAKRLQFAFPQPDPRTVAAAAIGGDQQALAWGSVRARAAATSGGCS